MTADPRTIEASYALCRRVTRRAGSSFSASFFLLTRPQRRAMEALYAFMRHTDDLGDEADPGQPRRELLLQWRAALDGESSRHTACAVRQGDGAAEPTRPETPLAPTDGTLADGTRRVPATYAILPAVADTVRRFKIPEEHLHAVIDGVEMDLDTHRYETFDDLAVYCHRVASAVGLACIHVWGFRGEGAFGPARACGIAFQLTNILRDLKEDAGRGRVYLPLEDLREHGYPVEDLLAGVLDARFDRLMEFQIARAERFYHEGAELIDWLDPRGRRIFGMMIAGYHRLLERIKHRPRDVFARRVRLGRLEKLRLAARWALLPSRRSALP